MCSLKADPPVSRGGFARSRPFCCRSLWREGREKCRSYDTVDRTKTDTGRRGEYPKALERTAVKELGNLTPQLAEKGSLLLRERAQEADWATVYQKHSSVLTRKRMYTE